MKIDKVESIVRMGEDSGLSASPPLSTMFQKAYFPVSRVYCLYISKLFKKIRPKAKKMKTDKVESIVRMGEDVGYQHPLPFPVCFKRPISL